MNGLVGHLAGDARCLVRVDWAFILVFMVGGHGWAATGRAITFMEPGLAGGKPRSHFGICAAIVWLAWGIASWRFLFGK
jgi:hypothetical protein